jgi:hypothetical protein
MTQRASPLAVTFYLSWVSAHVRPVNNDTLRTHTNTPKQTHSARTGSLVVFVFAVAVVIMIVACDVVIDAVDVDGDGGGEGVGGTGVGAVVGGPRHRFQNRASARVSNFKRYLALVQTSDIVVQPRRKSMACAHTKMSAHANAV